MEKAVGGDWIGMSVEHEAATIRDCGPRDGLQGEAPLPATERAAIANGLAAAGVTDVEAVLLVSPCRRWPVRQMLRNFLFLETPSGGRSCQTVEGASWRSTQGSTTSR